MKMNQTTLNLIARNLVLLALVAMPLFFVLVWVQALLRQATGATDLGYAVETGGVYYLTNVIPVLLGGLIHQVIWLVLSNGWPIARRRIVALMLAPVIPVAVLLSWGGPAKGFWSFGVPMILTLVIYVLLMRRPATSQPVTA